MQRTKAAVRRLVEDLEAVYGRPQFVSRYPPLDELVSCILSQHTTDATSFPTFDRLRERFPNWAEIASLPQEELAEHIRPAGLPNQKSRTILRALETVYERFGDYTLEPLRGMPMEEARAWLTSMPGIGPKTAAIVLCFGFEMPAIPVDTHVFRVSWRLGLIDKSVGADRAHALLEALVPTDLAYRFHTALIQHGRQICRAPRPHCHRCPVASRCDFYRQSRAK